MRERSRRVCPTADGTGKRERLSWSLYGHSVCTLPASEEDAGSLLKKSPLFYLIKFDRIFFILIIKIKV